MKTSVPTSRTTHYCDSNHPRILQVAFELSQKGEKEIERFAHIFQFVRDHILFGFPPKLDRICASDSLDLGIGYCNSKSILLVALCRAAGLPARLHAGLIDVRIMRGIIPGWMLRLFPDYISHLWVEVHLKDGWHPVDAHILDFRFFQAAQAHLADPKTDIGFGIAYLLPSCDGDWDGGFIQSNAVVEDHGTWNDASDYIQSPVFVGMNWWHKLAFPLVRWIANRRIGRIRGEMGRRDKVAKSTERREEPVEVE